MFIQIDLAKLARHVEDYDVNISLKELAKVLPDLEVCLDVDVMLANPGTDDSYDCPGEPPEFLFELDAIEFEDTRVELAGRDYEKKTFIHEFGFEDTAFQDACYHELHKPQE